MKRKRLQQTNEAEIGATLFSLLASGGTLERALTEIPAFKAEIQSAFNRMKSYGNCTAAEIGDRAHQLREALREKEEAIRRQDFDLAAEMRDQECKLIESLGLKARTGEPWNRILNVAVDEQIKKLSELLHELERPAGG